MPDILFHCERCPYRWLYVALQYGGLFIAICSGVGAIVIMRGLTTAVMSNGIPSQPQRNLHAIRNENLMINSDLRIIYGTLD